MEGVGGWVRAGAGGGKHVLTCVPTALKPVRSTNCTAIRHVFYIAKCFVTYVPKLCKYTCLSINSRDLLI